MTPNTVQIRNITFGRDLASGRQRIEPPWTSPVIRCAVQPRSVDDLPENMREQGVLYLTVKFYDDPGLKVRDEILSDGRTLVVVSSNGPSGGAYRTWQVDCEYRSPAVGK